jgi:hypothetical protein
MGLVNLIKSATGLFFNNQNLRKGRVYMATMTILEAEKILDIVSVALRPENPNKCYHSLCPVSSLRGYDIYQIYTALLLRLANEYLLLSVKDDFEERFASGVDLYRSIIPHIFTRFIDDNKINELKELELSSGRSAAITLEMEITPNYDDLMEWLSTDERLASLAEFSSLAEYCKSLGSNDPIYWQKIYTRLGLEYTYTSPKWNLPVLDQ